MSKGAKTVSFKVPAPKLAPAADQWVSDRVADPVTDREGGSVSPLRAVEPVEAAAPKERMSRFTIDVPESLHRRVKMQCAGRGVKMADMMRDLLEREFPQS